MIIKIYFNVLYTFQDKLNSTTENSNSVPLPDDDDTTVLLDIPENKKELLSSETEEEIEE